MGQPIVERLRVEDKSSYIQSPNSINHVRLQARLMIRFAAYHS